MHGALGKIKYANICRSLGVWQRASSPKGAGIAIMYYYHYLFCCFNLAEYRILICVVSSVSSCLTF